MLVEKGEALRQSRPAVSLVFPAVAVAQGLAEILLVDAGELSFVVTASVIALDHVDRIFALEHRSLGDGQVAFLSQSHAKSFILDDSFKTWDRRFENVRARRRAMGEIELAVLEKHGELLLSPRQGEPQVFVGDKEGTLRHPLNHPVKLFLLERFIAALVACRFALGQQGQRSRAFPAQSLKKLEVVPL